MDAVHSTIDVFDRLRSKYREYLRTEIVGVAIIQSTEAVWLESVENELIDGWEKRTTRRINLDFIVEGDDEPMFNPTVDIVQNAKKLVDELDPYSICNTTDLFTEKACQRISRKYDTFGIG